MRTTKTIELVEGVPRSLEQSDLADSAALAIHESGKLQISWPSPATGFKYLLRSDDLVGQIPIGEALVVRVAPKVPVSNLFQMLEVAYNLKSFELHDGVVSVDDLPELIERLASILAKRVLDRVRRGLYRAYLDDEASLPYVRGRIDVRETTRLLTGGAPAVHCRFQEHTSDLDDNQILFWTLNVISRLGLMRSRVLADVRAARRAVAVLVEPRDTVRHQRPDVDLDRHRDHPDLHLGVVNRAVHDLQGVPTDGPAHRRAPARPLPRRQGGRGRSLRCEGRRAERRSLVDGLDSNAICGTQLRVS